VAYERWLHERTNEWIEAELRIYAERESGVELVSVDATRFAGRYHMEPSAVLVVDDSLGTGPNHHFSTVVVQQDGQIRTFAGEETIRGLFQPAGDSLWDFTLMDAF
jgi:hypothetical protein